MHRSLVEKYTPEAVIGAVQRLVSKGHLRLIQPEADKNMYVLEPASVSIRVKSAEQTFETVDDLLCQQWVRGDVHSSDLSPAERVEVERRLKSGESNYVIATPTLEMGIDIGDLNRVVMLGVPPAPGNYAQRAGRAGRKHEDRSALIVCICSDRSPHDAYFSRNPEAMLAGVIPPPAFNPANAAVARKHLHAWLLTPFLSSYTELRQALERRPWLAAATIDRATELFGSALDVKGYIERHFVDRLNAELSAGFRVDLRSHLYDSGFFPDYGFHREEIEVRDPEQTFAAALITSADEEELPRRTIEPIAKREPEQAYRKFRPGRELPAGGRFYRLETPPESDAYVVLHDGKSPEIRSYKWMIGRDEGADFSGAIDKQRLVTTTEFQSNVPFIEHRQAFAYLHDPECRIVLINHGVKQKKRVIPYSDSTGTFRLGYELRRNAIVFRTDQLLLHGTGSATSFLSAAAVSLKHKWGIADDELRVLPRCLNKTRTATSFSAMPTGTAIYPLRRSSLPSTK